MLGLRHFFFLILLYLSALGLGACDVPTPAPTITPTMTQTVTPTDTITSTPTVTNTPTNTPIPTDTPTVTPTPTPACPTPNVSAARGEWKYKIRVVDGNGCYRLYHCNQSRIELYDGQYFGYGKAPRIVLHDCREGDEFIVDSGVLFYDNSVPPYGADAWKTPTRVR